MSEKIFDSQRDAAQQVAAGSHFYCHACLVAVPVDQQSNNPDYCRTCLTVIDGERASYLEDRKNRDTWLEGGQVFVHYGKKYALTAGGKTICTGPVDSDATGNQGGQAPDRAGDSVVGVHLPTVSNYVPTKRGPKFQELPEETIKQLSFAGLSSRGIADKLAADGYQVSCKTVQRRMGAA